MLNVYDCQQNYGRIDEEEYAQRSVLDPAALRTSRLNASTVLLRIDMSALFPFQLPPASFSSLFAQSSRWTRSTQRPNGLSTNKNCPW